MVGLVVFDNREELLRDNMGGEGSRISGEVDAVLYRWASEDMGGFLRRLSDNRYLFLTDESHVEEAKQRRFRVLDDVRAIKSGKNNMSATISVGLGRGSQDIAESERWARQALDMALGRGGDQVAIKNGNTFEFFGGVSNTVVPLIFCEMERRTCKMFPSISDHLRALISPFRMPV